MKTKKKKVLKVLGIVGLFVLVLGLSYALFRMTLVGRKKAKITSGILKLELLDENNNNIEKTSDNQYEYEINMENAVPISDEEGLKQKAFKFKVKNSGTLAASYTIYLDDIPLEEGENRLNDKYVKYSLKKNNVYRDPTTLKSSENLVEYNKIGRKLDIGILNPNNINEYELHIWVDENADSEAINKVFNAILKVDADQFLPITNIVSGSLADNLVSGGVTAVLGRIEVGNLFSGLYSYTDQKGEQTYFYRGISELYGGTPINNYVSFAGSLWRVLRIQEDGTVKLLKEDELDFDSNLVSHSYANYKEIEFMDDYYEGDFLYSNSRVKRYVEEWYNTELISYDNKIVDNNYCEDTTESPESFYSDLYGVLNTFSYDGWDGESQEFPSSAGADKMYTNPRISCRKQNIVSAKVALPTADELVLAGEFPMFVIGYIHNTDDDAYIFTMSPRNYNSVYGIGRYGLYSYSEAAVRPVITLKANVSATSGNGTKNNPYVVE